MLDTNFNNVTDFYKKILSNTLKNTDAQIEYDNSITLAKQVLEISAENLSFFFFILMGNRPDAINMTSMFFTQRFIKRDIDDELKIKVESLLVSCFMIGFIYHFIYMKFPTRQFYQNVNYENLFNEWLPRTLVANIQMRDYNKEQKMLPVKYFKGYYSTSNYESIFKNEFGLNYFKRGRILSYLENIMFCGIMYGMHYDLATNI